MAVVARGPLPSGNRFYLKGDGKLRAKRFGLILGIHLAIYLCMLITLFIMFSGGFVGGA